VLALPPVITLVHRDLGLDEKGIAAITGMTPLLLAVAAIPGSLLIARVGARRAVIGGLLLVGGAGALRGVGPSVAMLAGMTFLMALGIALIQPAFPSIVRQWFPDRVGLATAVYSNGLLMGEIIAAALTVPLLPLFGGTWEVGIAIWSVPVVLTAAWIAFRTPNEAPDASRPPARWWPDWRDRNTWALGFIFGAASALYWGANAFIPDYLHGTHRPALVGAAITALNAGQIPASILIGVFARRVIGHRWPFVAMGLVTALSLLGFLLMPGAWALVWSAVFGFTAAAVLVLTLALPPLLAEPNDVHRISAGIFTISYTCSFLVPLLSGAAWDATGIAQLAFAPAATAALVMTALPAVLRLPALERTGVAAA
jgi:CP family cyanate transporter-like MFS transporter